MLESVACLKEVVDSNPYDWIALSSCNYTMKCVVGREKSTCQAKVTVYSVSVNNKELNIGREK